MLHAVPVPVLFHSPVPLGGLGARDSCGNIFGGQFDSLILSLNILP